MVNIPPFWCKSPLFQEHKVFPKWDPTSSLCRSRTMESKWGLSFPFDRRVGSPSQWGWLAYTAVLIPEGMGSLRWAQDLRLLLMHEGTPTTDQLRHWTGLRLVTPGVWTVCVLLPCLRPTLNFNVCGRRGWGGVGGESCFPLLDSLKNLARIQRTLVPWTRIWGKMPYPEKDSGTHCPFYRGWHSPLWELREQINNSWGLHTSCGASQRCQVPPGIPSFHLTHSRSISLKSICS